MSNFPFVRARKLYVLAVALSCVSVLGIVGRVHATGFQVDTNSTLSTSLQAYYPFQSNSNDSLNSHNGTDSGSPTYSWGHVDHAVTYSGSNYSHMANAFSMGDMSYSFWINTNYTTYANIISEYDTVSGSGTVMRALINYPGHAGKVSMALVHYGVGGVNQINGGATVNDGNWHHVVMERSGGTYSIYVDDSLDATSGSLSTTTVNAALNVAGEIYGSAQYDAFNGSIDEVGVWSKALSSQEITDLYNSGLGETYTDEPSWLGVGQYKLDATTALSEGAVTVENGVAFGAHLYSASGTTAQLEVEEKSAGSNFTDTANVTSASVSPGGNATATFTGSNGQYHWQARAKDSNGVTSAWELFGPSTTSTDFEINNPSSSLAHFQVDTNGTLRNNLQAYYPLEASPSDVYGPHSGNDASSPTYGSGKVNSAVTYSGSNYSHMATAFSVGDMSYSFWLKTTSATYANILSEYDTTSAPGFVMRALINYPGHTGKLSMALVNYGMGGVSQLNGSVTVNDGVWHHVVMMRSGGTYSIYIDGSLDVSASSLSTTSLNAPLTVGGEIYGGAQYDAFTGSVDELGVWSKALSSQEITDLYHGNAGDPFISGLSLTSLNQYKSDATTTIPIGASTTESYVKFGATLQSPGTSTLQLQVEVQPAGTSFTNTPNATSSFVATGTYATAVFGTSTGAYPRDPESWSNGSFHWQARVKDSNGSTSTWQLFGVSTSSTDFVINTVPEYMQKFGPWPFTSNATDTGTGWWHNDTYADGSITCGGGNTIGFCGCAITTVSMWLRAYGITVDGQGHDVNPGRLNTWLTSHSGYDAITGALNWTAIENYASSTSGVITFDLDAFNATSGFRSYVDSNLGSSTPNPVILREDDNEHFVLATGFARNAATSTYTVRDSAWYDTQYLNQATSTDTSSTIYGYRNNIDAVRIYYDPPTLPLQEEYHVNLPNGIMLVDSQGRRTGKDPATGVRYHEIAGTAYGEDCLSKTNCAGELITTDLPNGHYIFYILGSTGNFGISAYNNRGLSQVFRGDLQPGTMVAYTQDYKATAFASSTLSFAGALSSTASVTAEPPHNLPLPPVRQPVMPTPEPAFVPSEVTSASSSPGLMPPPRASTPRDTVSSSASLGTATSSISFSSSSVSTSSIAQ